MHADPSEGLRLEQFLGRSVPKMWLWRPAPASCRCLPASKRFAFWRRAAFAICFRPSRAHHSVCVRCVGVMNRAAGVSLANEEVDGAAW